MYYTQTTFTISAAHQLDLDYQSPCGNLHGHNWNITVHCKSAGLDNAGMVMDFKTIKTFIRDYMDHRNLNVLMPGMNPTAENMAKWICDKLGPICYKVEVQETEGNVAIYERD